MSRTLISIYKTGADNLLGYTRLSEHLPYNFIESALGLNAISIGDDAYPIIQDLLTGGNVKLYWDLAVSLSNTLRIESNTEIKVLSGKGAVLRTGINRPMFMNKNIRFRDNSTIIDENILIDGGIWNGNSAGQSVKGSHTYGPVTIFSWFGAENLHLKNHKMYTPKTYAQMAINILNGIVEDFVVDVGSGAINMDGVHFDGWCNNCRISRGVITTYDDGVGCNADDLYYDPDYGNGTTTNFWTEDPCGPSSNIIFEDLHFINSLFGVRVLSSKSRVDNIIIRNLSGNTRGYSVLIDNYWQKPQAIQNSGTGDIGSILVDNNTVKVDYSGLANLNEAKTSLSCSIEYLMMTNITPNTGNAPDISVKDSDNLARYYNYGIISINSPKKVLISGDSTLDAYACRSSTVASKLFTDYEQSKGFSAFSIAVAGHTINQQLTMWNNLSNKTQFDIIIVQIGLNDMDVSSSTTISNYQNYINQIVATKRADAKIHVSCMLPCKQRFIDLGNANGQSNWIALNNAIMNTITGVDERNNYHVSLLDDGNGNLRSEFDCGDHIHENQVGADIIIKGFRNNIFN